MPRLNSTQPFPQVSTSVSMPADVRQRLVEAAISSGVSLSSLVRVAIENHLATLPAPQRKPRSRKFAPIEPQ